MSRKFKSGTLPLIVDPTIDVANDFIYIDILCGHQSDLTPYLKIKEKGMIFYSDCYSYIINNKTLETLSTTPIDLYDLPYIRVKDFRDKDIKLSIYEMKTDLNGKEKLEKFKHPCVLRIYLVKCAEDKLIGNIHEYTKTKAGVVETNVGAVEGDDDKDEEQACSIQELESNMELTKVRCNALEAVGLLQRDTS
jgi:hypothetical protein